VLADDGRPADAYDQMDNDKRYLLIVLSHIQLDRTCANRRGPLCPDHKAGGGLLLANACSSCEKRFQGCVFNRCHRFTFIKVKICESNPTLFYVVM
jgi:hypothetical protein